MDSAKLFFRENPFPASPSSERYLAIGSVEAARRRLMDAIDRRECPGMLVGPPGTGKSLLCTLIAGAYSNEFDVVLLAESRLCTRKALLQHLLHHLGLPYSDKTEGELRLSLIDRAASGGPASRAGLLIVVDEAHTLPGRLLEELRMMSGIVRNGSPRVQLVLAGGPSLDERFAHPRMEAFSQRVSTRCYLHPLGQNETGEYIRGAIRHAGGDPQSAIDSEAIAAVYYAADGIPRLINQTMSRAVALAESESQQQITADIVQRAWADLQQLPSPVVSRAAVAAQAGETGDEDFATVEFGTLDDCQDSDPMADTVDYEVAVTHKAGSRTEVLESSERETAEFEEAEPEFSGWQSAEADSVRWQSMEAIAAANEAADLAAEAETAARTAVESEAVAIPSAAFPSVSWGEAEDESAEDEASEVASAELGLAELEISADASEEDASASVDAVDWRPAVVGFGSWESAAVEPADWESAVAAASESDADELLANESRGGSGELREAIATDVLALFGDGFDEEEPLCLNLASLAVAGESRRSPASTSLASHHDSAETALHREIVSINAEAVRNQTYRDFGDLQMCNDIMIADDSDLLVIEDDIELDSRPGGFPPQRTRDAAGSAADVDFQTLFTRMREG